MRHGAGYICRPGRLLHPVSGASGIRPSLSSLSDPVPDSQASGIRIQRKRDVLLPWRVVLRKGIPHPGSEERDQMARYRRGRSCL